MKKKKTTWKKMKTLYDKNKLAHFFYINLDLESSRSNSLLCQFIHP